MKPLRQLATQTIDVQNIFWAMVNRGRAGARFIADLDKHLFRGATLSDLPEQPRFIFVASNMGTGIVWQFSREYVGDHRIGRLRLPSLALATATACSASFPPFLSPMRLDVGDNARGDVSSRKAEEFF